MSQINTLTLRRLHRAFERRMLEQSDGIPFTGFGHPFFLEDEVDYKQKVRARADDALALATWTRKSTGSGQIRDRLRVACSPNVSKNLLEHRFGVENGPAASLYLVEKSELKALESQFYNFFKGGPSTPDEFGHRFDALAEFLRANRLRCSWPFMAYLAFIYSPHRYFPILPKKFDQLFAALGLADKISGAVSWENYRRVLDVAEELRSSLSRYGRASAIDIQSYMWILSYLIDDAANILKHAHPDVDYEDELRRRLEKARERERIGLEGEKLVLDSERRRLDKLGRRDLSERVRLVSAENTNCGYDVLSFDGDGSERHVEVKTTFQPRSLDRGFFVSSNEHDCAKKDPHWMLARVWSIDDDPRFSFLGNMIAETQSSWSIDPITWFIAPLAKAAV